MLKWFRKYNKIILIVGCVVLMIAFLIPQAVSMFSPQPQDRVVGTMNGAEIKVNDLNAAGSYIRMLEDLFRGTGVSQALVPYDREQWLMIQKDAERLGLDASGGEVNAVLESVGISPEMLDTRARELGAPAEAFREAVRQWLVTEQYRMLMTGRRYDSAVALSASPGLTTINLWGSEFLPQIRRLAELGAGPELIQQAEFQFALIRMGQGRISPPATAYVLANELERVGGRVVMVQPEVDDTVSVEEPQLERLFEEYKSYLPGQGVPYPFGYRQPQRVKVEYLHLPAEAALSAAKVEPLDVLAYYRDNRTQYADAQTGEAPDTPIAEVRAEIEDRLRFEKAGELMRRALAEARAALDDDVRALETVDNYKVLPEGFSPIPLEEVADRVAERTGLTPVLTTADDWQSLVDLSQDAFGFGGSMVGGSSVSAAQYMTLTRELLEEGANPPAIVQIGVALPVSQGPDQSLYIGRLVDAQSAEDPASLDEVREQVTADARRVAAYERLANQTDALQGQAAAQGIDTLAAQYDTTVTDVPPIPRRDAGAQLAQGRQSAPNIPTVGRSPELVDQVFGIVSGLPVGTDVATALPAAERIVTQPVDRTMAVAVFEATQYTAPTQQAYDRLRQGRIGTGLDFPLLGDLRILNAALTKESLADRLDYDLENEDEDAGSESVEESAEAADEESAAS